MRSTSTLSLLLLSSTCTFALAAPPQLTFDSSLSGDDAFDIQGARNSIPLIIDDNDGEGTGHLSQWSKGVKHDFLAALESNSAQDWTLVMGNEGGGLSLCFICAASGLISERLQTSTLWRVPWLGRIISPISIRRRKLWRFFRLSRTHWISDQKINSPCTTPQWLPVIGIF